MTQDQTNQNTPHQGVVVGLDDSAAGQAALSWAARYARQTGQPLHALHVLEFGAVGGYPLDTSLGSTESAAIGLGGLGPWATAPTIPEPAAATTDPTAIDPATTARSQLPESVQHGVDATNPEPSWTLEVASAVGAGAALVERSHSAALLVIGTGVHTGLERLAHGSVSHYCLSHTAIPVVAVPAPPPT